MQVGAFELTTQQVIDLKRHLEKIAVNSENYDTVYARQIKDIDATKLRILPLKTALGLPFRYPQDGQNFSAIAEKLAEQVVAQRAR